MKNNFAIIFLLLSAFTMQSQILDCTDPTAKNFNPQATLNNSTCKYPSTGISPVLSVSLADDVRETSGLVKWNGRIYTHNDNGDSRIYELDSITGAVVRSFALADVNEDWEELAQDESHFYIGNFGNNVSGGRTNLSIIRVSKESLLSGNPKSEYINFRYANQTNFASKGSNKTDFDCEAFIVSKDSIFLFTKQWTGKKTSVYALPKEPGSYVASFKAEYDVDGLITGATWLENKKLVILSGYSGLMRPFFYLLYDFKEYDFFSGNKRKITMNNMSFHQVEGIATTNGMDVFVTNEHFEQKPLANVKQQIHKFNLAPYLSGYLKNFSLSEMQVEIKDIINIYQDRAKDVVHIDINPALIGSSYYFKGPNGKDALRGKLDGKTNKIDVGRLRTGLYTITIEEYPYYAYKLIRE